MTRIRGLAAVIMLMGLLCAEAPASATARGGFFESARPPSIQFDKRSLTWTLRNQAVERVVRFDSVAGALRTVALRDVKHNWSAATDHSFEGGFTFASPIIGVPAPLASWKTTAAVPPRDWAATGFDDSAWSGYEAGGDAHVRWYRARIPAGLMTEGHAWALLFDRALHGEAEVYLDGALAQKVGPADRAADRLLEIDIPAAARLVAIKLSDPAVPADFTGTVSLGQVGTSPPNVDLGQDWKYVLHSTNIGDGGSLVLSISLAGLKRYEGFDVDVYYQIYPGDEPYFVKWFTFTSHRSTRFILDEVTFDRIALPGGAAHIATYPGSALAASDAQAGSGLFGDVLSVTGRSEASADGKSVALIDRPGFGLRPDAPQDTARSVIGLYRGPVATGAFLCQLYIGQYISRATPASVPNAFNTWYGYREGISAAKCETIVPIAADLGLKLFILDHGWETNGAPDTGALGDWATDRSPLKFPNGLLPISLLVRERRMRFGLWTAPTAANEKSQAVVNHSSWLLRQPGSLPVAAFDGALRMCFTSGWADNYTVSMRDLCRALGVTYLKVDGKLFHDFCCDPAHDHPVGRAIATQADYWGRFCDELRRLDPEFLINRSTEAGPELTSLQDEGICTDWQVTADPKLASDAAAWYQNADLCRRALYDLAWTRPPFTLECEAPCHIPAAGGDLNALEYHLTSAGAYVSNMEIHGRLEEMKPEEQALVKKWLRWNEENRPWLAYSQPLEALGRPWDFRASGERAHVDGVLHLRPPLEGRYGYLCLWNPGADAASQSVSFRAADYLVKLAGGLEAVRLKDGRAVPVTVRNGAVTLPDLPLAPRSWEIYELRQAGRARSN
jgi:hypothetical protein